MQYAKKLLKSKFIKDYLGPTGLHDLFSKINTLPAYTELPTHITKAIGKQFKGPLGRINLRQGATLGAGLAGSSLGADISTDSDFHEGRATALGALGLLAPALYRGGRSGAATAKRFHRMVQDLAGSGLSSISKKDHAARSDIILNALSSPIKTIKGVFGDKAKKDIATLLKPSNTVTVDYLNNMQDYKKPLTAAVRFGRRAMDAGIIQNPNAARAVHNKMFHEQLKAIGLKKLYGTSGELTSMGKSLSDILTERYRKALNKLTTTELETFLNGRKFSDLSKEEISKLMPQRNAHIFPFSVDIPNVGKVTFKERAPAARGSRAGWFSHNAAYANLAPEAKNWLKGQGIPDAKTYQAMTAHLWLPLRYGKQNAIFNPEAWVRSPVPNLRHFYAPRHSWHQGRRFNYNLTRPASAAPTQSSATP